INNVVQRVSELVVQAGNGTNNQSDLNDMAGEVNQLIDQVKQDADTQYNGQYIFSGASGAATSRQPYQSGATDTYGGGTGAVTREIGPGTSLQVDVDTSGSTNPAGPGGISSLLGNGTTAGPNGDGDGLLLDTLRTIASDMGSGNTSGLGGTDLTNLQNNLGSLGEMQAQVGTTQDRLQLATSRIQDLQDSDTQALSNTQDADMATTEINFSTQQAAYEAALKASASIVQESLVDFLGNG
ncbi:MAG: flagellin, partial [Solirubrobacteraceae bacterium]